MKINRVPPSNLINQYIHVRENAPSSNNVTQSADKVELTKDSMTFSAALKEAKQAISVRTPQELKRIEDVGVMVRENRYSVRGEDVAAKILGLEE